MTPHTSTDEQLTARDAATRAAALAEAVKWHEDQIPGHEATYSEALRHYELSGRSSSYGQLMDRAMTAIQKHKDAAAAIRALSHTPPRMVCVDRNLLIEALNNGKVAIDRHYRSPLDGQIPFDANHRNEVAAICKIRAMLAAHGGKE